jgi:uncharacterized membrane protein
LPVLMIGNVFTVYLWYVDLALINVLCLVCISLYLINYALTGIALIAFRGERVGESPA